MRFAGKLALVAGGTGALGRAVAQAFLREGSDVVVSYQNEQEFLELRRLAGAQRPPSWRVMNSMSPLKLPWKTSFRELRRIMVISIFW